jgi:roadblock/LC7 domain-containing protein
MSVDLNKVMQLAGAVAAGHFSDDGKMLAKEGHIDEETAHMVAMMCAANTMMGKMQAENFSKHSQMHWAPFHGFAVSAGDYTVCTMGHVGVFVETAKADFNQVFKVLGEVAHSH